MMATFLKQTVGQAIASCVVHGKEQITFEVREKQKHTPVSKVLITLASSVPLAVDFSTINLAKHEKRSLTTGSSGKAIFEHVPLGSYSVTAAHGDYAFLKEANSHPEGTYHHLVALPGGSIRIKVQVVYGATPNGTKGMPIEGATVTLNDGSCTGTRMAPTDKNGIATFLVQQLKQKAITVEKAGFQKAVRNTVVVDPKLPNLVDIIDTLRAFADPKGITIGTKADDNLDYQRVHYKEFNALVSYVNPFAGRTAESDRSAFSDLLLQVLAGTMTVLQAIEQGKKIPQADDAYAHLPENTVMKAFMWTPLFWPSPVNHNTPDWLMARLPQVQKTDSATWKAAMLAAYPEIKRMPTSADAEKAAQEEAMNAILQRDQLTPEQLKNLMSAYLGIMIGHRKELHPKAARQWVVVNEPLLAGDPRHSVTTIGVKSSTAYNAKVNAKEPPPLANFLFVDRFGDGDLGYIYHAFEQAHAADNEAILILNDHDVEALPDDVNPQHSIDPHKYHSFKTLKAVAFFKLLKQLKEHLKKIDEQASKKLRAGFQLHYAAASRPDQVAAFVHQLRNAIRRLGELAIPVIITELSVAFNHSVTPVASSKGREEIQVFGSLVEACLSEKNCEAIHLWHLWDYQEPDSTKTHSELFHNPSVVVPNQELTVLQEEGVKAFDGQYVNVVPPYFPEPRSSVGLVRKLSYYAVREVLINAKSRK